MKRFANKVSIAVITLFLGVGVSTLYHRLTRNTERRVSITVTQPVPPAEAALPRLERVIPRNWYKVDAKGYFTFYLPKSVRLSSTEQSEEAVWGSIFSNNRIQVDAEYTSWSEGWDPNFLSKQVDYEKQLVEISGRRAVIRSWCWAKPESNFKCAAELRVSDQKNRRAHLTVGALEYQDLELAKQIFRTVELP